MLAFYVDPKVIDTSNFFDGEISRYVDFIRATKPVAGVDTRADSITLTTKSRAIPTSSARPSQSAGSKRAGPGDPERKMRAERTKNGVPLPDDTWAAIVNTAREVGVSEASIQRATS